MNSRQRVQAALRHQQPDRVPIDFGSTPTSGIHCSVVAGLREHYGLKRQPVKVHEPYQMLGWVDDDLKAAMGIDVDGIPGRTTLFGFANQDWKEWRAPWDQELLVSRDFNVTQDAEGDTFIYPEGDTRVGPSGRMPAGGYFFDAVIRQDPIDESRLRVEDNLQEFGAVDQATLDYLAQAAQAVRGSGRGVIAGLPGTALGDIALVPAPFLKQPRGVRDVAEWYMLLAANPDHVKAIFERQTDIALANLPRLHQVLGDAVDAVFICGTDFGTQSSRFCSEDTFRDLYLPYYRRMTDWIHTHTTWKCFKHSCGAVEPLISGFLDAGFDVLNPVQCSAVGMDPAHLKKTYGSRITFWGGGVDTQQTLPFGTPAQVREQVLRRCEIFAPGGGFVFNSIHNVQARTPVANVVAMLEAVHEFNGRQR